MAQLGARVNGIHEVTGSIPVWSTTLRSRLPRERELRVASHPSRFFIEGWVHPSVYDDLFALWKDADVKIPVVNEARAEYARLR